MRHIMHRPALLCVIAIVLAAGETPPGDRNPPLNIVYPPAALAQNGGQVHDITQPPYGAKGDGRTDDTRAFVTMMNAVRDGVERMREKKGPGGPSFFYVPNGTYLVSDSIVPDKDVREGFCGLRLIGQDRRKTIIKLKDGSPGFQAGSRKPLLTWSKDWQHHQCGIAWGNELRNLTIDTGSGNPGAVGVLFMGANACSIDNLTVRSGDGQGYAGLWFPTWAVQGYFNDITVQGFDHGIELLSSAEVSPAIEWVTLKGQKQSGIHIDGSCPSLRKIASENTVPALRVTGAAAHVVLLDSRLSRGDKAGSAIVVDHPEAQLFVRDVETSGYGKAVDCAESLRHRGAVLAIPAGTTATASFATNGDGGPDKLLDGNPDTFLAGAPNSVKAPRDPVWVDVVFPAPVADLAGIELGGAEKFGNYFAKEIEIWADTDGDKVFDTPVARIAGLGGGGKQACLLDFGGRMASVSALRLLVAEQNRTGGNRAFHMNGIALITDAKAAPIKPAGGDAEKRIAALRAGSPPELVLAGKAGGSRLSVAAGKIAEWLNGVPVRLGSAATGSMRMPVEEVPPATWDADPAQWATPEGFGGDVQAALSSGKPNVMLAQERYEPKAEMQVPKTILRFDLMNANARGPIVAVTEASDQPLWIEHPGNRLTIEVRAPRPIFVRYGDAAPSFTTDKPVTAHLMALANTGPAARSCPPNVRIFARSINNENKGTAQFPVDGGRMWVLAWKTEGPTEGFAVRNGGVLEVLGGYRNNSMKDAGRPLVLNDGGQVSMISYCNMGNVFREAIWETRGGETRKLTKDDLPLRSSYTGNFFIPLYLGYDPVVVAPLFKPASPLKR
jgi:hypothetical protein